MKTLVLFIFILTVTFTQTTTLNTKISSIQSSNVALDEKSLAVPVNSIPRDHIGMRFLNTIEFAKKMLPGWNVDNPFESIGGKTVWRKSENISAVF